MEKSLDWLLDRSRTLGFLGPGETEAHSRHANALGEGFERHGGSPPASFCDLGAGGGVPGLVLALRWADSAVTLLDGSAKKCRFLQEAVDLLGIADRVTVSEGRAEDLARVDGIDGAFELVVARSFGPPAVTAECGVRMLAPNGVLLVAEPPAHETRAVRWPAEGLALLGLGPAVVVGRDPQAVVIPRIGPCPDRYPRRVGVPAKQPLF